MSRIFILSAGRSGGTTLAVALGATVANHTVGCETKHEAQYQDLEFPDDHIEVDNRLFWFLPLLEQLYPEAQYWHLKRERKDQVRSLERTHIVEAFRQIAQIYGYQRCINGKWTQVRCEVAKQQVAERYLDYADAVIGAKTTAEIDICDPDKRSESIDRFWDGARIDGDKAKTLELLASLRLNSAAVRSRALAEAAGQVM